MCIFHIKAIEFKNGHLLKPSNHLCPHILTPSLLINTIVIPVTEISICPLVVLSSVNKHLMLNDLILVNGTQ